MVGNCFYHDTFPTGDHLFVVLAPSLEQAGWFVCVNITTKRENSDVTCELTAGTHPELTKPVSVVCYGQARELPEALIRRLIEEQGIPPMPGDILLKIQTRGVVADSRLKNKLKRAVLQQLERQNPR